MSALSADLLAAEPASAGEPAPPRRESSEPEGQEQRATASSDASGAAVRTNQPHAVALWPADDGLVSVGPSALRVMQFGAEGPAVCRTGMWTGAFTFGMVGGAWAGLSLLPFVGMPLAGGWFACSCIMGIPLFRLALQAVRVHIADMGFVSQVLSARVSPQCSSTVNMLVMGIQVLQVLFVVSQTVLYCAGVVMVLDVPGVRPDMVISMLVGMIALFVGSFQVAAMIVAVITSCEVLHDCCRQLVQKAVAATTAEQLHAVYVRVRELDQTLQRAVVALRPIVLSVSSRTIARRLLDDPAAYFRVGLCVCRLLPSTVP
jgi:hypothetical protein|eukprot:COSAG02_NODE_8803_length_2437_cov_634.715141_3_plen_317_part_00